MIKICFATQNQNKIAEVQLALGQDFQLIGLKEIFCEEELPETQNTLEGNALQKARYVFENYQVPCFADDTGLEVEALRGAPGVLSARYAGPKKNSEENLQLLLRNLGENLNREARFRTVIALVTPAGTFQFEGYLRGTITTKKIGTGGFGYDPIFKPHGFSKTLGEMSMEEKNQISHRAMAIQKLIHFLKK